MSISCADVRDLAAGFVLGALTPDEDTAVRKHLATCQVGHPEVEELGGVVPYLAESVEPVEPRPALRGRILSAAAADRRIEGSAPSVIPFPDPPEREVRTAARAGGSRVWALRIAAVVTVLALGAWNLQLQTRLSGLEGDLAAARAYRAGVAAVLAVAAGPGARSGFLAPTDAEHGGNGVAAAAADGTVIMAIQDLAPTVGEQVYEAWVILGSASPVPLGSFTVGPSGTGLFRGSTDLAQPGAILALTLEPAPGATTPTLPVLTLGSISGSSG